MKTRGHYYSIMNFSRIHVDTETPISFAAYFSPMFRKLQPGHSAFIACFPDYHSLLYASNHICHSILDLYIFTCYISYGRKNPKDMGINIYIVDRSIIYLHWRPIEGNWGTWLSLSIPWGRHSNITNRPRSAGSAPRPRGWVFASGTRSTPTPSRSRRSIADIFAA